MRHSGFTLVELLVSSTLAVLLCGAAALMISAMGRELHTGTAEPGSVQALERTLRVLARDLEGSLRMRAARDSLVLYSLSGLCRSTPDLEHRPVLIEYRLAPLGVRRILLRREYHLEEPSNDWSHAEVVSAALQHFEVRPTGESEVPVELLREAHDQVSNTDTPPRDASDTVSMALLPDRLEVVLWPEGPGATPTTFPVVRP